MDKLGIVAGVLGILVCIVSVIGRYYGSPQVFGMEARTVLLIGTSLLVLGCFLKTFKK